MVDVILRTLLCVQPALSEAYRCYFGATQRRPTGRAALTQLGLERAKLSSCFEILGFDVLVRGKRGKGRGRKERWGRGGERDRLAGVFVLRGVRWWGVLVGGQDPSSVALGGQPRPLLRLRVCPGPSHQEWRATGGLPYAVPHHAAGSTRGSQHDTGPQLLSPDHWLLRPP